MPELEGVIGALVGAGWDREAKVNLRSAEEILKGDLPRDVFTAAATANLPLLAEILAADPGAATRRGGPRDWSPLLYLSYSFVFRLSKERAEDQLEAARLLLAAGADPNDSYADSDGTAFPALYATIGVTRNLGVCVTGRRGPRAREFRPEARNSEEVDAFPSIDDE